MSRLTALHMSYTVSAATAQAVMHSISTPVRSVLTAVAVMSTMRRLTSNRASTVTASSRIWWHSGISCHVILAAHTPASRATDSTSPFLHASSAISLVAVSFNRTLASATAVRRVSRFPETSTMHASPERPSTCVKRDVRLPPSTEAACLPAVPSLLMFPCPFRIAPRFATTIAISLDLANRLTIAVTHAKHHCSIISSTLISDVPCAHVVPQGAKVWYSGPGGSPEPGRPRNRIEKESPNIFASLPTRVTSSVYSARFLECGTQIIRGPTSHLYIMLIPR